MLDQDLRFADRVEQLAIQQVGAQRSVEDLHTAVRPMQPTNAPPESQIAHSPNLVKDSNRIGHGQQTTPVRPCGCTPAFGAVSDQGRQQV